MNMPRMRGDDGDSPPLADGPGEEALFDHVLHFIRHVAARRRRVADRRLKVGGVLVDQVDGAGFERDEVPDPLFGLFHDVLRPVAVDDVLLEVDQGQGHFEHVLDEPSVVFQVRDAGHQLFRV
jgi:hypothetical protein